MCTHMQLIFSSRVLTSRRLICEFGWEYMRGRIRKKEITHQGNLWQSSCRGQPAGQGWCSGWGHRGTWSPGRICQPCRTLRQRRPYQSQSYLCSRPWRWHSSAAPELRLRGKEKQSETLLINWDEPPLQILPLRRGICRISTFAWHRSHRPAVSAFGVWAQALI